MPHLPQIGPSLPELFLALIMVAGVVAVLRWSNARRYALPLSGVALLILLLAFSLNQQLYQHRNAAAAEQAQQRLAHVAQHLHALISNRTVETRALAGFLIANPDISQADYTAHLERLLQRPQLYTNVAYAPDLVVDFVFPVAGNEAMIGQDYRTLRSQWPGVEQVVKSHDYALIGPVALVQGGLGLILRDPVIDDQGTLLGVIGAVLPLTTVLEQTGINALAEDYKLSIVSRDSPQAQNGYHIAGYVPSALRPWVEQDVSVAHGVWSFRMQPREALAVPLGYRVLINGTALGGLALAIWVTLLIANSRIRAETTAREAATTAHMLEEAQRVGGTGSWMLAGPEQPFQLSAQLAQMLGSPRELWLRDWPRFLPAENVDHVIALLCELTDGSRDRFHLEHALRTQDGGTLFVEHSAESVPPSATGEAGHTVGTILDISSRKESEQRLHWLAYFDTLTGVPNRHRIKELGQALLLEHHHSGRQVALLVIDIDHFKVINDSFGHESGDEVLRATSGHIGATLPANGILGRSGGDEFTVLLPDCGAKQAEAVAQRILDCFVEPLDLGGRTTLINLSIGISVFPGHAHSLEDLWQRADLALDEAEKRGGKNYALYSEALQASFQRRTALELAMPEALERGEFFLAYQPRICMRTDRLVGLEALLRWRSPTHGIVTPDEFIPLAEASGFIVPLGDWVIREALREVQAAGTRLPADLTLAINLSARQIQDPDLTVNIASTLARYDFPGTRLELEITETFLINDLQQCEAFMKSLAAHGVGFALDDFGTGYSNLVSLKHLPLRCLKIDKSFVHTLPDDADGRMVVEAIVDLGHRLGMTVVAEGVEDSAQRTFLHSAGCDELQGYLYSPPLPMHVILDRYAEPWMQSIPAEGR